MKSAIVVAFAMCAALLVSTTFAAPTGEGDAQVLRFDSDVQPNEYSASYETSNGIKSEESGHLENAGTDHEAIRVKGSFEYIGDDHQTYRVTYIADENGFQPQGAHLPVPPV